MRIWSIHKKHLTIKVLLLILLGIINPCFNSVYCQVNETDADSIKKIILSHPNEDTVLANLFGRYAERMAFKDFDTLLLYSNKSLSLSKKLQWPQGIILGYGRLAVSYGFINKYDSSIFYGLLALRNAENFKDTGSVIRSLINIGGVYRLLSNDSMALIHLKKALTISEEKKEDNYKIEALNELANLYGDRLDWSNARKYAASGLELAKKMNKPFFIGRFLETEAAYLFESKKFDAAIKIFQQIRQYNIDEKFYPGVCYNDVCISKSFSELKQKDSAYFYANAALEKATEMQIKKGIVDAYDALFVYASKFGLYKEALQFHLIEDSLNNESSAAEMAKNIERSRFQYEQEKKDIKLKAEQEKKDYTTRRQTITLLSLLFIMLISAGFLFWNLRLKQKAKNRIETAYEALKNAQQQLIQSEKMASLGELTAGIAHEIQNPLNFINNFSEVSNELLVEMKEELEKGNYDEAKEIANDVIQNLEKITHHGKRADGIVKGMLQHSRSSSGQKELTDINALCDEYLRLSYHGLRAKDKTFNAKFETIFDEQVGKIEVVPQEISRVVLNLLNNAFYAVTNKKKTAGEGYDPTVTVSTKKLNNAVEIKVADNGPGIPDAIKEKIFQPFFTTKPTGQGTGLGLSLSYDIVTKGHNGELKVETNVGTGTTFIIILPA